MKSYLLIISVLIFGNFCSAQELRESIAVYVRPPGQSLSFAMSHRITNDKKEDPFYSLTIFGENDKLTEIDFDRKGAINPKNLWSAFYSSISSWTFSPRNLSKMKPNNTYNIQIEVERANAKERIRFVLIIGEDSKEFDKVKEFVEKVEKLSNKK